MKNKRAKLKRKSHDDLVAHFQKRCMERLGYILHQRFLKEELAAKRLPMIGKQSNTRTHFLLKRTAGKDMVLVYDKRRHAFVTCLFYDEYLANAKA